MDNFDTTTNTIYTDGTSGSIAKGSGQLFIKQLKEDTEAQHASDGLKQDWKTIKRWLGCENNEINDASNEKIALAWQSYLALGISPSQSLDKSFAAFKVDAAKENWEKINVPKEVKGVFDRLLATDSEIAKKQLLRYDQTKEKVNILKEKRDECDQLFATDCEITKKKSEKNKFAPISFVKRKADSISNELALSKSEAKAWKIIVLLGCFAGFMLKYFTTTSYDSIGEWLHPYEDQRFEAFMWALTGGVVAFLVLYATRLLNSSKGKGPRR